MNYPVVNALSMIFGKSYSEVRGQRSEVRGQRLEVKGQRSKVNILK